MSKIVIEENISKDNDFIKNPTTSGYFITEFERLLEIDVGREAAENIISNSINALFYFKDPASRSLYDPQKILCLGKVQSGKTSFFLGATALAFDNGYDITYILGGTKNNLKEQNLDRAIDSFKNNEKIKIFDLTKNFNEDIDSYIQQGFKIIILVLKNASENTNLGEFLKLSQKYNSYPSIIIDDEGDEFTPGSPNTKNHKGGKSHDKIAQIITSFKVCTFLSVTATPQANLLISTYDSVSPKTLVLVKPGKGYIGGNDFFDTKDNPHIVPIKDIDDFKDSIPQSFISALNDFIFACAIKRSQNDKEPFSMMVHPSSLNRIQNTVSNRIANYINKIVKETIKDKNSISYKEFISLAKEYFDKYVESYPSKITDFITFVNEIDEVINKIEVRVVNFSNVNDENNDSLIYKILVGGNMLGRGLTIDRLIISYIYRDSKKPAVDTMYQRCRWFGYKLNYFDVCKVYMTSNLRDKFSSIVDHENNLWTALEAFLDSNTNIKEFKRIFSLNNENLILTRKSVSDTIVLKSITSGHKQDLWIDITDEEQLHNINLYRQFIKEYGKCGKYVDFDNSVEHRQQHLLIELKYSDFYNIFLSKFIFSNKSQFSAFVFGKLIDEIKNGIREDKILIMVMRPKFCETHKTLNSTETSFVNILQGRNLNTDFTGDSKPIDITGKEYSKLTFIQIHLVKLNDSWSNDQAFPMITFNNPITASSIRLVTGGNIYG